VGSEADSLLAGITDEHFTLFIAPILRADAGRSRFSHNAVSLSSGTCFIVMFVQLHVRRRRGMRAGARRGSEHNELFLCRSGSQSNHAKIIVDQLQAKCLAELSFLHGPQFTSRAAACYGAETLRGNSLRCIENLRLLIYNFSWVRFGTLSSCTSTHASVST
jgi:hypothetical protein